MTATEVLVASAWKGTVLLVFGFAVAFALRRKSAATRHWAWAVTLAGLLALPATMLLAPHWAVAVPAPAPDAVVQMLPAVAIPAQETAHSRPILWPLLAWLLGAAATATWFVGGIARVLAMKRSSLPISDSTMAGARVLEGPCVPVPLVWGLWRPVILLPREAREWPPERLRATLLHEWTHIQRHDLVVQALAQLVTSVYWFHPLVWLAGRQLRKERERACDDAVLRAGFGAPEYAGHLIELARSLAGRQVHAPAMAEQSDLEGRVRALLDRRRSRHPLSGRAATIIACGTLAAAAGVAVLRADTGAVPVVRPRIQMPVYETPVSPAARPKLMAQAPARSRAAAQQTVPVNGPISGIVLDPNGARVPGCQVIARNLDGPNEETTTTTGPTGAYRFDNLPPGRYLLQFNVPGFKPVLLMAGSTSPQYVWLTVGSTQEAIVVSAPKPAVVGVAPQPAAPQRIRVGGNVQPARLISRPATVYPPELQQLGIEGTVVIEAIIGKTGEPTNLQVLNANEIDPRLAQAAINSVSQWRFQPTLLNGEPVAIETTVNVDFRLEP